VREPVLVRERHWRTADPVFRTFDLAQAPLEVAGPLQQAARALTAVGFRTIGHACTTEPQSNIESYASILVSPDGADIAQMMAVRVTGPRARVVSVAAFRREFADDTCIAPSNGSQASSVPPVPRVDGIRLSQISDVSRLYEVHRAFAAQQSAGRTPRVPEPGTGCYHASYPALQWHAVRCMTAPRFPGAPRLPSRSATPAVPATVGGSGSDYSAKSQG